MLREDLKKILPHRDPMLLLDEAYVEDGVAHGIYNVKGDEWFLQGHYPGNPVVPGVVLCEIMAQTCGVMLDEELKGKTPYYTGIDKVRFKNMVKPGDMIEVKASVLKAKGIFYFTSCEAYVKDKLCAKGELSFALVEGK